jgi:hydroxymethylbilane synthase
VNDPVTTVIRIATRASALALWQAHYVQAALQRPELEVRLVEVITQGDRDQQAFRLMQGTGFFTKAVQLELLEGRADIAVHSYKDLPSEPAPGLQIAAVTKRADSRDVLLINPEAYDATAGELGLKRGSTVGTSAVRRQAQLELLRPDLQLLDLRGNVPTRIQKLRDGHYDAIVLAAAGLERLQPDLSGLHPVELDHSVMVSAPAQGALALEVRSDDERAFQLARRLHDPAGYPCIAAERGLMARLDAGCQLALGAWARPVPAGVELTAWYEGQRITRSAATADEVVDLVLADLKVHA